MSSMKRTHMSLYYVAAYLLVAGIALTVAPRIALGLLLSTGDYGDVMPRFLGVIILALGIVVTQIVRHSLEVLYTTTLVARAVILLTLLALFAYSRDRLFLVVMGIVGLGVALTGIGYVLDRRAG